MVTESYGNSGRDGNIHSQTWKHSVRHGDFHRQKLKWSQMDTKTTIDGNGINHRQKWKSLSINIEILIGCR